MDGYTLGKLALVAAVIPVVAFIVVFNRLVAARNGCRNARAGIDAQLARRHDLVPNLVSVVAGYAAHERETLRLVTEARGAAIAALGAAASPCAEEQLDTALAALVARVEAYPELKASEQFLHLQRTLTEVEEQISAARRAFNAQVATFNNLVEMFPTLLVARLARFTAAEFYASAADERGGPSAAVGV